MERQLTGPGDAYRSATRSCRLLSTRDLSSLPEIVPIRQRMQQMATLESIFSIEFGEPTFAFHPQWSSQTQMGSVKNGSGDELFAHFTTCGCFIKGFAHESTMTPYRTDPPELWPGLLNSVPNEFASSLREPAFDIPTTTFAIWRLAESNEWHSDAIEFPDHYYGDGSEDLLSSLMMSSDEFAEWIEENYEVDVDRSIIARSFTHEALTELDLRTLNPDAQLAKLKTAVLETGYTLI